MGTLTAMWIASRRRDPAQRDSSPLRPAPRRQMLSQFSPVAFTGSTLLLITGATAAWWYLGQWANLWRTSYGRLLLLKLCVAAAAAGCGFVNWQTLRQPVDSFEARRSQRLLVGLEITLAAAIVIVTALLTESEHP
jgi:copper transport protein